MVVRTALIAVLTMGLVATASAEEPAGPIVFPKDKTIVGSRVNLVLDPTEVPFFQVIVGKTEYPVIDTSTGKHAFQGLELEPGLNTLTIKVFAMTATEEKDGNTKTAESGAAGLQKMTLLGSWERLVFSTSGISAVGKAPAGFTKEPFHSREHETGCSGCHGLDAPQQDAAFQMKAEEMICYACHRKMSTGKHIHGPVAVWNCLSCHDPDLYPVKYQFAAVDPWKVSKTIQPVDPIVFTVPSTALFAPDTAAIVSLDKAREALSGVLNALKQNPEDRVRLEAHTDDLPPKRTKEKTKGKPATASFKTNQALTNARAKALLAVLKEWGVPVKNITSAGMGSTLPKAPNTTPEGRELNNRIEIVLHPADIPVRNSQQLTALQDRERVQVNLFYAQGPQIKKLTVLEKIPKGSRYVPGSGIVKGRPSEPRIMGDEMAWELGDRDVNFAENLSYVMKKEYDAQPVSETVTVSYEVGTRSLKKEINPKSPAKRGLTVQDVCFKCHEAIRDTSFKYKHGPVAAGYCSLCHDPHASKNRAWLRDSVGDLCTTCHVDKVTGLHAFSTTHPMKKKKDPLRPGKKISCVSCHEAHSASSQELLAYNSKKSQDLCKLCHGVR